MIEVTGLTKSYGGFTAVDDVSFRCEPGRVTGFLGPNGAGKTTTMRAMVGLTPPTRGTATIGGMRYADIPNPGRHVGVLLDASAQHNGRTGREVRVHAAVRGDPVLVSQGSVWAATFHPELTGDTRVIKAVLSARRSL